MRIAIDAMGGDKAPDVVIEALKDLKIDAELVAVGKKEVLESRIENAEIVDAPEVIGMDEHPLKAIREKKESSIVKGVKLIKEGKADAFLGAGNTGAYVAAATLMLGRIKGVIRPALGTFFPTVKGYTLVVDVGANSECKPEHLLQFGIMGSIFYGIVFEKENPTVGLLSIGEEDIKGSSLSKKAFELLKDSGLNFIGNVEGHQILYGVSDVVVCDGFVGNAILKFGESIVEIIFNHIKNASKSSFRGMLGAILLKPSLKELAKRMDYEEYGGALLMGVNGIVIICHGRSSPRAIRNAIKMAYNLCKMQINKKIEERLCTN